MRKEALILTILAALSGEPALAARVDAQLIPDGQYKAVIEKVVDAKHLVVKLDNGVEAEFAASPTVHLDGAAAGKTSDIFVYKGTIITFKLT